METGDADRGNLRARVAAAESRRRRPMLTTARGRREEAAWTAPPRVYRLGGDAAEVALVCYQGLVTV